MDILKFKKTYTTKFILPLLFRQDISYTELFNNDFLNAYLGDMNNSDYDDKILLMFNDYPSITLTNKLSQVIDEYKHDNKYVFVFDLPKEYSDEYYTFLAGKYNNFKQETKDKILSFWDSDENTLLFHTLNNNTKEIRKYLKNNKKPVKQKIWFSPIIKYEMIGVE